MKILTKRRKNWLVAFTCMLGVYLLISIDFERPSLILGATQNDSLPQWTLSDTTILSYDEQGKLLAQLSAKKARFFTKDDHIAMTAPHINYYQKNELIWHAKADTGSATQQLGKLRLVDNVVFVNTLAQQSIQTQALDADFNKNLLNTDKAVTISTPNTVSTAIGMTSNWQDKSLTLLDNVNVQITPRH